MKQFDREIDLLNKLRSPYVVNFVGAVNVPGKLYLLTGINFHLKKNCLLNFCFLFFLKKEFIKLGSLTSVLEKVPVGLNVRIKMMKDAAKGLEFLHACGIIHRDVKAANMLVFSIDYEAPVRIKLTGKKPFNSSFKILKNIFFFKILELQRPLILVLQILKN